MNQCKWIILICIILFVLTGCVETNIIEELSLVHGMAYDEAEGDQLELTAAFPNFVEQGEESALFSQILTGIGRTTNGAIEQINMKSQRPIKLGQSRVYIFSSTIAENGIEHLADALYRNPDVPNRVQLAVSVDKAKDIFNTVDENEDRVGVYIPDLIDHVQQLAIPPTNLHLFLYSMYNDGRDAYLPLIKGEDELNIIGTALFDHDKYVAQINLQESYMLRYLTVRGKHGTQQHIVTHEGGDLVVTVENITSTYRVKMENRGETPTFIYHVHVKGEITDSSERINIDDPGFIPKLEKEMKEEKVKKAEILITKFKELKIDPLGLGEQYRSRTRNWQPEKWEEMYQDIDVEFNFNVQIIHSGAIE
ncbi:Ger(x)C family spore germination protein [Alkalihalobacterium chitinilyticum]|uniref:Ger(X)C family spore germination protein n=1 Tax=Alkalihalobacterium chitinilyticum TaxID=2980103 RepID=A0ABT5V947_9BACI|nr:Ger(x)C family spore germination protein [Alkalihalobacterium chitinilyticum]MDE5411984.1 Ger(x)C family spore germination protein [Alkalihalobacterium chitinilyticum]